MQKLKRWSHEVEKHDSFCLVKNTTVSELEFCRSRIFRSDNWISERMVAKHFLKEVGYEVTLVNHVDSQSAKAWACGRGLGRRNHVMLKYMFVQDVVEKQQTTLAYVNTNSNRTDLMTKCHTIEAHMKGCAMLGLKLSRDDVKIRLKQSVT